MVMGGNSCSEGRGFESSTVYWMDIFHIYCCKIYNVCLKDKINEKEAGDCPFL